MSQPFFECTELTWPLRKYRRCKMSQPFSCMHGDDVDCAMTPKLPSPHPGLRPRVLPGLRPPRSGLGLLYIYQCHMRLILTCFIICRMPGSTLGRRPGCGLRKPRNYRRSRHHILSFACRELTWPPRKYRKFEVSHPFYSIACTEMTLPPMKYKRCKMSQPFFCVHGVDVDSQKAQKVRDITTFLLHAGR
jgi:hypothetical protein